MPATTPPGCEPLYSPGTTQIPACGYQTSTSLALPCQVAHSGLKAKSCRAPCLPHAAFREELQIGLGRARSSWGMRAGEFLKNPAFFPLLSCCGFTLPLHFINLEAGKTWPKQSHIQGLGWLLRTAQRFEHTVVL